MPSDSKIRMLHFSDMHVGMKELREKWPRAEYALSADLEKTIKRMGGCDLVLFTGDLAYSGKENEYDEFAVIFDRILNRVKELGGDARIVITPGNHDLGLLRQYDRTLRTRQARENFDHSQRRRPHPARAGRFGCAR